MRQAKAKSKRVRLTPKDGERLVYEVPEAGRMLGLSRNGSYSAAARGEIPTIRLGRLLKVPKRAFDAMLECAGLTAPTGTA